MSDREDGVSVIVWTPQEDGKTSDDEVGDGATTDDKGHGVD